jgi:1-phosphofructokinase
MIATVTLNPALDKTLVVPDFAAGKTNRGQVERLDPGGKGTNVAKALRQLGCPVVALGFAAGLNGQFLRRALDGLGIPHDFIDVPGETRVNLKIEDPLRGIETELNESGFPVTAAHLAEMERRVDDYAARAEVMVFAGSLPPGAPPSTYAGLIRIAAQRGAKTILDASGAALREGVAARPDLVKVNRAEAEELLGSASDLEGALGSVQAMGPAQVVISLGAEGAVAACGERRYRARPPRVETRCTVGAGDAMTAAFACALASGAQFMEALRLATAAGAATAASGGSSVAARAAIEALLGQVEVTELDEVIAR